ncbi:hypothetical protein APHCRT_0746 [Anaplasma phagocytophilum str. CRT53-1]|uniref:Uncharacterized protein n=1 Tax=Anaplasma phagocytophilum str. CRT53-1 TaxID=1359157 RepID=A0A0F3Q0Z2_ANAPH|nr:hypothetical protein APHCRT_0746 [Anaplasma phagocytophilum str. CRT53-1]
MSGVGLVVYPGDWVVLLLLESQNYATCGCFLLYEKCRFLSAACAAS